MENVGPFPTHTHVKIKDKDKDIYFPVIAAIVM
jgi:hypothetical protein